MNVDIAIVETGLGGKWDATNILTPIISVITKIGIDHQDYLGTTLEEITKEKAGIIKNRVPCVISDQDKTVVDSLVHHAREAGSKAVRVGKESTIEIRGKSNNWNYFDFEFNGTNLSHIYSPLIGEHQLMNAGTALTAVSILNGDKFILESDRTLFGLKYCTLEGRFEKVDDNPPFIVDVGHNPDAFMALKKNVEELYPAHRTILLFGVMREKKYTEMLSIIAPLCKSIIGFRLPGKRALSPEEIAGSCSQITGKFILAESAVDAIRMARDMADSGDLILAAGSHVTVQEIKNVLCL